MSRSARRYFAPLGDVTRVRRAARGVLLDLGEARFRIDVIRDDVVRMKLARSGDFDESPSFAACFELPATPAFELTETDDHVVLTTQKLRVVVSRRGFGADGYRSDGTPLFEGTRWFVLNDEFIVERRIALTDAIYGLGQKTGASDRRGRRFVLWNVDVVAPDVLVHNRLDEPDREVDGTSTRFDPYYTSIPFFHHVRREGGELRAAGFFVDNPYQGLFDFRANDAYSFRFSGGQYTEYVFAGPGLRDVLEGYTFVTGRMHLPPLWSLGHHQCRWHDYTDRELLEIGRQYRERDIPCDALWLDIGHMDGFRVFTWHPERFPDPPATLRAMSERGFRSVAIVDPGLKVDPGYRVFEEARRRGLLCKTEGGNLYTGQVWPGETAFPDFSREDARRFWSERIREQLALGLAGIWNDMNEPATGRVDPFAMRFDRDGANHAHERFHNQYALLMAMATRDGQLAARPNERPFTLSRAGSAGIQRLAAQWLGDNCSRWEHLAMSIPMALGMGLSGQPFVGADIPGFAENATPELAARWFQLGALTPFCRCHNIAGAAPKYPWSFGPTVEAIARQALKWRYRLLPYLYTAFQRSSETGEPVQRPLFFDFPDDPNAADRDDQFLLGDALLVAPVLALGDRRRRVYLPERAWLDWHTDELVGPGTHTVDAPLERIPVFARAGAVIPLFEQAPESTSGFFPELLELHVSVPQEALTRTSALYEDDGWSFAYRDGAFVKTEIELERRGDRLTLVAQRSGDGFPEFRRQALRVVLRGARATAAELGGRTLPIEDGAVRFENAGEPFELVIRL